MKIVPLKQKRKYDCGPASLRMAFNYFKLQMPYKKLVTLSGCNPEKGTTTKKMINAIKKMGLKAKSKYDATWKELKKNNKQNNVVIILWMLDGDTEHYSVVEKLTKRRIYFADPWRGRTIGVKKKYFMKMWVGYKKFKYPKTSDDVLLRWMCVINKGKTK